MSECVCVCVCGQLKIVEAISDPALLSLHLFITRREGIDVINLPTNTAASISWQDGPRRTANIGPLDQRNPGHAGRINSGGRSGNVWMRRSLRG